MNTIFSSSPGVVANEAPRVVLDTNAVMALWVFKDARLARLLNALAAREIVPLRRDDALAELRCVLAYPQFALTVQQQAKILEDYAALCLACERIDDAVLPPCKDGDDQKFLEIARDGGATFLITRDKALLKLARHRRIRLRFSIVTPETFCALLAEEKLIL